jgi:hemerythrin-like metal-binding protein
MSERTWKIEWNESMSVGIAEIDEEHKNFIGLVNRFNDSVANRMDMTAVVKAIGEILDFVAYHFPNEETLFKNLDYPDADDHAQKHAQLRVLLGQISERAKSEHADYLLIEAGLRIKDEIVNHLMNEDMKYADYFRNSDNPSSPFS